jgi:hypothetical protein
LREFIMQAYYTYAIRTNELKDITPAGAFCLSVNNYSTW